jgi:hypothetical protein
MATQPVEPGDAPANPERSRYEALAQHRDFGGFYPFADADNFHAVDRVARPLSGAKSILSLLSAAFHDSQELLGATGNSEVDNLNGAVIAGALDGVVALLDLAGFLLDDAHARPSLDRGEA